MAVWVRSASECRGFSAWGLRAVFRQRCGASPRRQQFGREYPPQVGVAFAMLVL